MITTDICIIGAGPVGLFTVFECGLLKMRCHLVDYLPQVGGQLTEIYPKKPIYDIPGYPSVLAGELIDNLMKQIEPFKPGFTLGQRVERFEKLEDGSFLVYTSKNEIIACKAVAIAAGLGVFEPRKPNTKNLEKFEGKGVEYMVLNPDDFKGKKVVLAGGGDSALDWAIHLSSIAESLSLVHRSREFRGAPDSVDKVFQLEKEGKIRLMLDAQVSALYGEEHLKTIEIEKKDKSFEMMDTDYFIPLFGLSPKLGPIADWGLQIDKNAIEVNTFDYSTNIPGIYAIGDINTYPGKLKLILCGFHEGTLMAQSAFKYMYPDEKLSFKYTTVNGVNPF